MFQDLDIGLFILFLAAYLIQPLLVDMIKFNGGAQASTFLFLFPHYIAMVLVGFNAPVSVWDCDWRKGLIVSCLDIVNQLLKKGGLIFAGSAVYIVMDSSSIVWTAFWSRLLLGRKLVPMQWFAIFLIALGCALRALETKLSLQSEEFLGLLMVLAAAILMGLTFVLTESFMKGEKAVPGPVLVCMMGTLCSVVLTVWTCIWTIPRLDGVVVQSIMDAGGNWHGLIACYFALTLFGYLHSSTLWYLVKQMGAVSSGVLKGLKVAGVFVLSHFLFCHLQESQCLRPVTAASALICVAGVIVYSIVTSRLAEAAHTDVDDERRSSLRSADSQRVLMKAFEMEAREMSTMHSSILKLSRRSSDVTAQENPQEATQTDDYLLNPPCS
eukprot:GHVL01044528.1.p1 GENE.GHVL01044528.1~~GHVL01044528.1.p1  ORF type:complete len:383 (-),score=30.46 GHVL01044528.1:930-2078(-)